MSRFHLCGHPLIQDKLCHLRDKNTRYLEFRRLVEEITMLMGYEIFRNVGTVKRRVRTPLGAAACRMVRRPVVFVSVLRAGLAMVEGLLRIVPEAKTGHIGIYRNEKTLEPVRYYSRLPRNLQASHVILADPMIATGGSAVEAVNILKFRKARDIRLLSIVSVRPGLARVRRAHPDVHIFTAAVDEVLNKEGYIVPGLGDAGDRIFGTD